MFKQYNTYRIQVWIGKEWRWGLHDYTRAEAEARMAELRQVRIKCRMRPSSELFN